MTEEIFWDLIAVARQRAPDDFEEQTVLMVDFLLDFTVNDLVDFSTILLGRANDLALTEIFAAFYFVFPEEPVSRWFFNFRVWLVGQGRERWQEVGDRPMLLDNMISVADKEIIKGQALSHAPVLAYFVKTHRRDFQGPDFDVDVSLEIPITENELKSRYAREFPGLIERFSVK